MAPSVATSSGSTSTPSRSLGLWVGWIHSPEVTAEVVDIVGPQAKLVRHDGVERFDMRMLGLVNFRNLFDVFPRRTPKAAASQEGAYANVPQRCACALPRIVAVVLAAGVCAGAISPGVPPAGAAGPEGTMTWGIHVTLPARWLDPMETEAQLTPFMVMYAIHDALVKTMPGNTTTPSLAESWTVSKDWRTWEFVLRKGIRFHNGDPVTAEDAKFSFERYKGAAANILKERVREVQVVDPGHLRFVLKEPWPDFLVFYGTTASGAAWVVPRKYVERVGDDGFRKAPIGAGPYK